MGRCRAPAAIAIVAVAAALLLTAPSATADPKKIAYGKHLSSECTSCHRLDGSDNGIPSITGWDAADFVVTMKFYQSGARTNTAMKSVAESLDDGQLEALATFFATLPKPGKK